MDKNAIKALKALPRSKADGVSEIADTTVVPIRYGEFLCTLCLDSVHMP